MIFNSSHFVFVALAINSISCVDVAGIIGRAKYTSN